MSKKFQEFKFPVFRMVLIIISFLLAIMDMLFLYKALQGLMAGILGQEGQAGSFMLVAFILATVANFTALYWGYENGVHLEKKSINKRSIGVFLAWLLIGIGYFAIRIIDLRTSLAKDPEGTNVAGHLIAIGILAVSYVGTGTLIQSCSRVIFDAELHALRTAKKNFDIANEDLANGYADVKESIGILKHYDINYRTLEVQYRKCLTSMIRTENATMSVIVSKMLAKHPNMNPKLANDILKDVIAERNGKWIEQEVSQSVKNL